MEHAETVWEIQRAWEKSSGRCFGPWCCGDGFDGGRSGFKGIYKHDWQLVGGWYSSLPHTSTNEQGSFSRFWIYGILWTPTFEHDGIFRRKWSFVAGWVFSLVEGSSPTIQGESGLHQTKTTTP